MRRAAALVCLVLALSGCGVMQKISVGAYKNAVADGAVAELTELGIKVDGRPECRTSDAGSTDVFRIGCTGRTAKGEPVVIRGDVTDAESSNPIESYVITVGGRVVLRKDCLGLGCEKR